MKPWLTTILSAIASACLVLFHAWLPIPLWAIFVGLFMALLFVCLYIRGHNLIQEELKAEARKQEGDRFVAEIMQDWLKNGKNRKFKGPLR